MSTGTGSRARSRRPGAGGCSRGRARGQPAERRTPPERPAATCRRARSRSRPGPRSTATGTARTESAANGAKRRTIDGRVREGAQGPSVHAVRVGLVDGPVGVRVEAQASRPPAAIDEEEVGGEQEARDDPAVDDGAAGGSRSGGQPRRHRSVGRKAPDRRRMVHPYHPIRTGPRRSRWCYRAPPWGRRSPSMRSRSSCGSCCSPASPTPPTRTPSTTSTSPAAWRPGTASRSTSIWIFPEVGGTIPANPTLPIPSNAHWMPLASHRPGPVHLAPGPDGDRLRAAVRPPGRAGGPAHVGDRARRRARRAWSRWAPASWSRSPLASAVFMAQPDNFGLYQPLVAGALWMGARGLRGDARAFALGGLLVGLATLARNDGVLVGAALALAFAWDRWRAVAERRGAAAGDPALGGRRLLRPLPRRRGARGSPASSRSSARSRRRRRRARSSSSAPSTSGTASRRRRTWSGSCPRDWARCWRAGSAAWSPPSRSSRVLVGGVFLVPFMVIGGWARRRSPDFGPFFAYAGLLFAFSALVSAVHVPGGTFIHSAVGLAPHAYVLALEGIAVAVGWVAARRSTLERRRPPRGSSPWRRSASRSIVAIGSALVTQAAWAARRDDFQLVDRGLADAGRRRRTTASCRSTRPARSTGPGHGGRGPRERPARDDRGGGPRLRHPLAGPQPGRHGGLRSRRSWTAAPRPPWLGAAGREPAGPPAAGRRAAPAGGASAWRSTRSAWTRATRAARGRPGERAATAAPRLAAVAPRGLAERRARLRRRAGWCASGPPPRCPSRSPRTRPTTGASPATSPRGGGSSPTRSGPTRRRRATR